MNDKQLYLLTFWGFFWIGGILACIISIYNIATPDPFAGTYLRGPRYSHSGTPYMQSGRVHLGLTDEEDRKMLKAIYTIRSIGWIGIVLDLATLAAGLSRFVPDVILGQPKGLCLAIVFVMIIFVQEQLVGRLHAFVQNIQEQNVLLNRSGHRRPPVRQGHMIIWDDRRNPDSYDEW